MKSLDEFHNKKTARDGKQSHCKACGIAAATAWNRAHPEIHRERSGRGHHLAKHGFTEKEWDDLLDEIDHKCQLCGKELVKPYADHNHETGLVRGVLCTHCNRGLGAFYDSEELLLKAIEFLRNPPLAHLGKTSRFGQRAETPNGWRMGRNPRSG